MVVCGCGVVFVWLRHGAGHRSGYGSGVDLDTDLYLDLDMGLGVDLDMNLDVGLYMDLDIDLNMDMDPKKAPKELRNTIVWLPRLPFWPLRKTKWVHTCACR
jgi:hypothetical protein